MRVGAVVVAALVGLRLERHVRRRERVRLSSVIVQGVALETAFALSTERWVAEDLPLTYSFKAYPSDAGGVRISSTVVTLPRRVVSAAAAAAPPPPPTGAPPVAAAAAPSAAPVEPPPREADGARSARDARRAPDGEAEPDDPELAEPPRQRPRYMDDDDDDDDAELLRRQDQFAQAPA